jgi:drug/metabolite transporter (DMT)-like permease
VSSLAAGLVLALGASVALNASFLLQHAGSSEAVAITPRRPIATLRSLLRSRVWLLGAAVGLTGWAMHVGALSHAPLSDVQAFVAGGLALTVPMAAIGLGRRTTAEEKHAAALMVVALVLLAVGLHARPATAPDPGRLVANLALLAVPAAALCARAGGARRPAALGLAGGLLYGAADLAIKAVTASGAGVLLAAWLAAAALATAGAFFAFQRGLQTGRAVTVIALMTGATNLGSIAGGFVVFGDGVGPGPALGALHVAGFALVVLAAWRLAPSQAAISAPDAGPS